MVVVDPGATPGALRPALEGGAQWLWLLDAGVVPDPRALEHLLAATAAADGLPAPVLVTSRVLTPDGSLDPSSQPVAEVGRSDLVVAAVGRHLLAVRVARRGSLLVHRRAFQQGPATAGHSRLEDDLAWTAGLLRDELGLMAPASVAVRARRGQSRAELARWWRLLAAGALAPRERPWFAFRLAELALASARAWRGR